VGCWRDAAAIDLFFGHAPDGFGSLAVRQTQRPQPDQYCLWHAGENLAVSLSAPHLKLVDDLKAVVAFPHMAVAFKVGAIRPDAGSGHVWGVADAALHWLALEPEAPGITPN
jgi:hypothetical protein